MEVSWEYENDPDWERTEDLETINKCEGGTKIPDGGCFGCEEGGLCE